MNIFVYFAIFTIVSKKTFGHKFYLKSTVRNENTRRTLIIFNVYHDIEYGT